MITFNQYLDIKPEVQEALDKKLPIVALESTIISHGMPYPQNVEMAKKVEDIIRAEGAVPATIAIMNGKIKICVSSCWVWHKIFTSYQSNAKGITSNCR